MNNSMVRPVVEAIVNHAGRTQHHISPCVENDCEFAETPANQIEVQIYNSILHVVCRYDLQSQNDHYRNENVSDSLHVRYVEHLCKE
jgi:hypothetical protein